MGFTDKEIESDTLVLISPGFPSNESDSTCLPAIQSIILTLNKVYPELKIIILSLHYPYRAERYSWHNNTVYSLNGENAKALRPLLWFRALLALAKIARNSRLLGVLSLWCQETALIGKYFCRWKGLRHMIWIQGQDARKENYMVQWIQPRASELIALSPFLRDEFARNHSIIADHLIYNGINPDLVASSSLGRNTDIIGVGSLISLKRYDHFIDIIKAIYQEKNELKVELIGSGPEESRLKIKIAECGLENVISLSSSKPHADVFKSMQGAKILLHPSKYEGYSTVAVEALFCGCHVVSYTQAEYREINQWHVMADENEMKAMCLLLLNEKNTDFSSVLVHDLCSEVKKLMSLYGYPHTTE